MSGGSSSVAAWFSRLESVGTTLASPRRPDDPRLGEVVEIWQGDPRGLQSGRGVLVGFPQDAGIRRNQGRPGAAAAPDEIRRALYRLTPWDGTTDTDLSKNPLLDAGNVRIQGSLEDTQAVLGEVIHGILSAGAVPIVLGGGHETAYGHFLGYVAANRKVGIINLDAHLDVRPLQDGLGHSGSPFRQALEHPTRPLQGGHYVCLGAQPSSVSRDHYDYVSKRGGRVRWADEVRYHGATFLDEEIQRLGEEGCRVLVTLDADVVHEAEVPGVSAPNPDGLAAADLCAAARLAGQVLEVGSFELVEINPSFDRDGQSVRWAALAIWHFLMGLAKR